MASSTIIKIQKLTVRYQGNTALQNIALHINSGKITGIIGPNGAGKSTLIKGMIGLIQTDQRCVLVGERSIDTKKKEIAYVEQRNALDLTFPINVEETVLLGTYPKLGLFKKPTAKEREKARLALEKVQLTEFSKRQIGELSDGQLQRVFIARVLAQDADIIFLDEPFVGIDMLSEKVVVGILKELKQQGKTIIIVHHDLHKVLDYFDDVILLKKELIAFGDVTNTFTNKNIQKAYGESMGDIQIKGVKDE